MTFNEFLASEEGRVRLNQEQAKLLVAHFARHQITVRYSWELWDFVDAHPEYFREITEQDKRDGLQTTAMMWAAYEEHRRLEALGTQRSLVGHARLFR